MRLASNIGLRGIILSIQGIEGWRPSSLVLTHFGTVDTVADHLRQFRVVLDRTARLVKASLESEGTDEERIRDKIAASKRKGLWVGGMAPLGYDTRDRKITVSEAEASSWTLERRRERNFTSRDRAAQTLGRIPRFRSRRSQARSRSLVS